MDYKQRWGHERTNIADGSTRRDFRRDDAEVRQAKRDNLTPHEQLTLIDQRLGKGVGASKERARLHLLIDEPQQKKARKNKKKKNG